ncbi:MAG: non-canonical purine NTP pyrophosphatase [Candidatus Dasytiphilus stammeri]
MNINYSVVNLINNYRNNMYQILLASSSKDKKKEFMQLMKQNSYNVKLIMRNIVKDIGIIPETGNSYLDNALIKANIVYQYYQLPVLSDDSGIELTDFSNFPGIYSNRYAGYNANDQDNYNKLQHFLLKKQLNFTAARYSCVLVYQFQINKYQKFEGKWNGRICIKKSVHGGFGYDPMFIPAGCNTTVEKLDLFYKNTYSHRAIAVKKLIKYIANRKIKNINNIINM